MLIYRTGICRNNGSALLCDGVSILCGDKGKKDNLLYSGTGETGYISESNLLRGNKGSGVPGNRGFTLLELMVVLFIISIFFISVAPKLSSVLISDDDEELTSIGSNIKKFFYILSNKQVNGKINIFTDYIVFEIADIKTNITLSSRYSIKKIYLDENEYKPGTSLNFDCSDVYKELLLYIKTPDFKIYKLKYDTFTGQVILEKNIS